MATDNAAKIAEARKRWKTCAEAEDAQRKSILAAKQFRAGEQWDPALKRQRQGSQALAGVPAQPPRPCLVVDRLSQPVRQTSNTIKNAEFGFDVLPNGQGADTETASIFKGYMRRVHNNARGESPVEWAADGAIEGGLGWFRLRTEYVHSDWDGDVNDPAIFDQELREERIANSLSVYCDPSSLHPTRRNARYMFVVEDVEKDEFTRRYPDADVIGLEEFMATGDMEGWISEDMIRIAEYWHVDFDKRTFCLLTNNTVMEVTKETPKPKKDQIQQERVMQVPRVTCDKINAHEVLESYEWVGTRIPLFPVLGEELNVDGKPVLRGIVQEGMDAQRMVNYTYSGAMELFALEPKSPWIAEWDAISDFANIWQHANTINFSYLPYKATPNGTPPQRTDRRGDAINAAVALMQVSEEAIKATTSTGDASLGNSHPNERSGRALQALQAASDLANSNYPDNVRRALIAAAEEMAIVIPKITRKGQIIHILGMDEEPDQVMAGVPFKPGANGVPEPAPPEITPEMAKLEQSLYKFYDLNNGKYAVTVTVGKANATKREEGAAAIGELIPHLPPEMAAVATPDYVRQLSFPGAQKMAERLEQTLPPNLQPKKDGEQAPDPAQLQQQLQQMGQQLQQAQQFIQTKQAEAQGTIQAAQIKAQADVQAAQAEAQVKIQIAHIDNAARIEIARIGAAKEASNAAMEAQEERLATGLEMQHEHAVIDHEAQVGQQTMDAQQQHAAQMAQQGQQASTAEAEAARQHDAEMQAQAQAAAQQQQGEA